MGLFVLASIELSTVINNNCIYPEDNMTNEENSYHDALDCYGQLFIECMDPSKNDRFADELDT